MKALETIQIAFAPEDKFFIHKKLSVVGELNLTQKDTRQKISDYKTAGDYSSADYMESTLLPIIIFRSKIMKKQTDNQLYELGYLKSIFSKIVLVYMKKFELLLQSKKGLEELVEGLKHDLERGAEIKLFLAQSIFYLENQVTDLLNSLPELKDLFTNNKDYGCLGYQFEDDEEKEVLSMNHRGLGKFLDSINPYKN